MPNIHRQTGALAFNRRDWFSPTEQAFQDCSHAQVLDGIAVCAAVVSDGTTTTKLADANVHDLCAGGGVAAWLDERDLTVHDTLKRAFPGAAVIPGAASDDGAYALKLAFNSFGPWDVLEKDGSRWRLTDGDARDIQLLSNRRGIWSEGGFLRATPGLPLPLPSDGLNSRARAAWRADQHRFMVVYQRKPDGALVCDGHVVAPPAAIYFAPDVAVFGDQVQIRWTVNQGDATLGPGVTLTLAELDALPPATSPPSPASTGTSHALQAFFRKLWIAPFFSISTRYGDTPRDLLSTYANAITIVPDAGNPNAFAADLARAYALGMPIICGAPPNAGPIVAPYIGNIVAWWVSGTDAVSLASSVTAVAAALPEKPIIAYLDSGDPSAWPASRPLWVTDRVWPGPQCYRLAGEPVDAFAARLHAMLSRLAAYGVYSMLTPRFDDVNGTQPVSFTTDVMPVYAELLQAYPLAGGMPFADRRGHGISADAELLGWAQAFARANVARPNRYDYWTPSTSTPADTLKNKLAQSIEMVVLSVAEKQFLLGRIG